MTSCRQEWQVGLEIALHRFGKSCVWGIVGGGRTCLKASISSLLRMLSCWLTGNHNEKQKAHWRGSCQPGLCCCWGRGWGPEQTPAAKTGEIFKERKQKGILVLLWKVIFQKKYHYGPGWTFFLNSKPETAWLWYIIQRVWRYREEKARLSPHSCFSRPSGIFSR